MYQNTQNLFKFINITYKSVKVFAYFNNCDFRGVLKYYMTIKDCVEAKLTPFSITDKF